MGRWKVKCLLSLENFSIEQNPDRFWQMKWAVSSHIKLFLSKLLTNETCRAFAFFSFARISCTSERRKEGWVSLCLCWKSIQKIKYWITEVDADFKGYEIFLLEILTVLPLASLQISFLKIYNIFIFLFIKSKFNMCS